MRLIAYILSKLFPAKKGLTYDQMRIMLASADQEKPAFDYWGDI